MKMVVPLSCSLMGSIDYFSAPLSNIIPVKIINQKLIGKGRRKKKKSDSSIKMSYTVV